MLQLPLVYDERALEMAANAARAAERAGIEHLVVNASTPVPPEPIGVPFIDARLIAAGAHVPRVTLLQPLTYMENLLGPWSAVLGEGIARYPMPADRPLYWVAAADVARAACAAIERHAAGSFALPGPAATGHEAAAALARALGRPVRWETIAPEAFADLMRPFLGDHAADGTAAVYRMLASQPPAPAPDAGPAREALGWAPRDLETWARETAPAGARRGIVPRRVAPVSARAPPRATCRARRASRPCPPRAARACRGRRGRRPARCT